MFYIEKLSSQHFDERNSVPRFIVLHSCYSSTHPNFFDHYSIIKLLDELRLSYHFLISRAGPVFEIVSPEKRAWHAGESYFPEFDVRSLNDTSIGISLVGTETSGYTHLQYNSLCKLIESLSKKYQLDAITTHRHIAPERKTDPWLLDVKLLQKRLKHLKLPIYS